MTKISRSSPKNSQFITVVTVGLLFLLAVGSVACRDLDKAEKSADIHQQIAETTPSPTSTATQTSTPTNTSIPPTATATNTPTPTITPTLSPPSVFVEINPENAHQIKLKNIIGKGKLSFNGVYAPDGQIFAVSTSIGMYLYDSDTYEELRFIPTSSFIFEIIFSPDGETILTSHTHTVNTWRTADGTLLHTLQIKPEDQTHFGAAVAFMAFYPNGKTIVTGTDEGVVEIWRASNGRLINAYTLNDSRIKYLDISPNGHTIFTASWDDEVTRWRVSNGFFISKVSLDITRKKKLPSNIGGLIASPDGNSVLTISNDYTVELWHVTSDTFIKITTIPTNTRYGGPHVDFAPDGQTFSIGSDEGTINTWRVSDGVFLNTIVDPKQKPITGLAISPDSNTILTDSSITSNIHEVKIWRVANGELLGTIDEFHIVGTNFVFSPDSQALFASITSHQGIANNVKKWRVSDGTLLNELNYDGWMNNMTISTNGEILYSQSGNELEMWHASNGTPINTVSGHSGNLLAFAISPDGKTFLSGASDDPMFAFDHVYGSLNNLYGVGDDRTVRVKSTADGALLNTLEGHTNYVTNFAFSPDGQTIISSGFDGVVNMWRASDGTLLNTLEAPQGEGIIRVAYSLDGQTIISQNIDFYDESQDVFVGSSSVSIWRASDGNLINIIKDPQGIRSMTIFPNGKLVLTTTGASSGWNNKINIWRTSDGTRLKSIDGYAEYALFSPDGKSIAIATRNIIEIWGVE